jgi:hypothetical protein
MIDPLISIPPGNANTSLTRSIQELTSWVDQFVTQLTHCLYVPMLTSFLESVTVQKGRLRKSLHEFWFLC